MPTIEVTNLNELSDFEDEGHYRRRGFLGETIELLGFPRAARKHLLLEAGAGFGKSTVLHAVLVCLGSERVFVPAYIEADELASSSGVLDYLERNLNYSYRVNIDWMALCRQGRAVLLIDGLDELTDQSRTAVLSVIEQVAAMFPNTPILVAARDRSALNLPSLFTRCRILRLNETQADDLLERYLALRPEIKGEAVKGSLKESKDLSALCSIPLFLALLVATLPRSGQLPRSRADLLERYLSLALAPQRHKTGPQPRASVTYLRRAAELLALDGLRRHEIAQFEDAARRTLGAELGQAIADDSIDDLLQCGLLVRRGVRIGFSIATVQEYLAGCALSLGEPDVGAWFRQIARRPWVQAVQFALERMSQSEPALIAQIDCADDVFHVSLRVIARSVVNGGRASSVFKRKIVMRLLAAWKTGTWRVKRDVAELLADGLALPPTPELIHLLVTTGDEVSDGVLLVKLGDRHVALVALKALLKKDDIRSLWAPSWIDAVKMIGPEAVELLLARSSEPGFIVDQVVASALYCLRDMKTVNWTKISGRQDLSERVSVACLWGAVQQNSPTGRQMISSLLETLAGNAVPKPGYIRVWNDYPQAYLSTSWWQEHLASIVVGNADSDRRRAVIFNALIDVRYDAASNGVALVKEIQRLVAGPRREKVLFDAVVSAASFKDATSEGLLLASLAENITEEAYETWASSFPYFTEQHKLLGLKVMKQKLQGRGQEGNVISELIYRSKLIAADSRQVAARGPFLVSNIKSESREFVCEWAAEFSASLPAGTERLLLISRLVEAGGNGSETLVDALEGFAARGMIGDDDDWTWVVTALHALEQTDRHISTNAMLRLVRLFPNFPTHSFFSTLIRREGRRVTDQICKLFAEAGPSTRAQIFSGLEDVAQSLGIAASWDALNNLRLDWVD